MNQFFNSLKRIGALIAVMMVLVVPANATYTDDEMDAMLKVLNENINTVFFRKPSSWAAVGCYRWNSTSDENAAWPGVSVTTKLSDDSDIYYYSLDANSTYAYLIFNDGQSNTSTKTGDLYWTDGAYYESTGLSETFVMNTYVITYTGSTSYSPPYCYVEDATGASNRDLGNPSSYCGYFPGRAMTDDNNDGIYTYTLITVKPASELYIYFSDGSSTVANKVGFESLTQLTAASSICSYTTSEHAGTYIEPDIVYKDYTYTYEIQYDNSTLDLTNQDGYNAPYCYIYDVREELGFAEWPGTKMTDDDNDGIYTCTLSNVSTVPDDLTIIFGDGASYSIMDNNSGKTHVQTANLKFEDTYVTSTTVHMPANISSGNQYATFTPGYNVDDFYSSLSTASAYTAYRGTVESDAFATPAVPTSGDDIKITKGEGLLLKADGTSGVTTTVDVTLSDADRLNVTTYLDANWSASTSESNLFAGALRTISSLATEAGEYTNYILQNNGSRGAGLYWANDKQVGKGKAYLQIPSTVTAAKLSSLIFSETTGIDSVTAAADAEATPAVYYNLAGQRVSESYKGVVIVNGKKVIRK